MLADGRGRIAVLRKLWAAAVFFVAVGLIGSAQADDASAVLSRRGAAAMLIGYFERMCRPRPMVVRTGARFEAHRRAMREKLLTCAGLWPLPDRVALDVHTSVALEHDWCRIRRVYYQLWPNVYGDGLLFMPKRFADRPAPAVLCPHGHWRDGNAHAEVQRRCLTLAKMGYVVFSPTQNHYEDPALGVSHQTLMIWGNMRAMDYLQSLAQVDGKRIGCAGASGGGLQTQMLVAVDDRVKAASICGLTCDYREIVFPGRTHCRCNHFPDIMRYTDQPEISTLGLPTPVQYLTMNDWTKTFERNNYPAIRRLYEANGHKDRTDCKYWPTKHSYDKPKRQRMYWWLEKWLRGKDPGGPVPEANVKTIPVKTLGGLKTDVKANKGFAHISRLYAQKFRYTAPPITNRAQWQAYRGKMVTALTGLLGEATPPRAPVKHVGTEKRDGLAIERVLCPSEAGISVPTLVVRAAGRSGKLPVVVLCGGAGSPAQRARAGSLVVIPGVRFVGELSLGAFAGLSGKLMKFRACSPVSEGRSDSFDAAWQRNAMLWGRPIPGMAATDIRAVLNYVLSRPDVQPKHVRLVGRGRPAIAALFAAALDRRVTAVDIDLGGQSFEKRNLPLVPFVLRHGDVLQWSALLADRQLRLAGVGLGGETEWLRKVFEAVGNAGGLDLRAAKPRSG